MNFGEGDIPDRRVLAGLAEPGGILLAHIPARLVLKPVMRSREDRSPFVPDDLLVVQEADPQQSVQHLARELRGVPDVGHLQAGHQFERVGPICPRIARDRGFGVALACRLLHVTRASGRPAAVQAGAVAPFRVEFDSVGRVCDHQPRLSVAQEPRHDLRARRIAA